MERSSADPINAVVFWPVLVFVTLVDVVTKAIAQYALSPYHPPAEVVGSALRLTLVYNPGAAFGLHVGPYSRWIFMALTVAALAILGRLYRQTRVGDLPRVLAIALVCGGAIGNLIDRVRSHQGVVDFIDVGFGDSRWPTFNVADMAVSSGALLLAWVLWDEEQPGASEEGAGPVVPTAPAPSAPPSEV